MSNTPITTVNAVRAFVENETTAQFDTLCEDKMFHAIYLRGLKKQQHPLKLAEELSAYAHKYLI